MKKLFILISFITISFNIYAQTEKLSLEEKLQLVVTNKYETYKKINRELRKYKKDTNNIKEMILFFSKSNYFIGKSYAENMLGIKYRNYSLYQKAITIHKQALKTAININNTEFQVFSLNMLGVVYRRLDANRTALDYSQEALEIAEKVNNPNEGLKRGIAIAHNSMGNIYLLLKQYNLAIAQFKQSQLIEKEINNSLGLAINYQNIGYAKEAMGEIDEALKYFNKSFEINEKRNNELGKVICNSSIANIYIKQYKLKKALNLINKNLPVVEKLGNKYYHAYELLNLGIVQTKLNNFAIAEKNLFKGLKIAKEYNLISAISDAYNGLSEFYEQKNDYQKSLKYYKLAEEYDEKISNERNSQYVNDLIIKYDSEKKNNEIKNLAKQNQIAQLQITKNRNLWIASLSLLLLSGFIVYFMNKNQGLRHEKALVKLEQTALRSQMNPHFIFNSLNSIKLYIIDNEKENAVYYLNKFSKLIRKILAATKEKETTLDDEIETMKLYINIENIRFENSINSKFIIDKNLNINTIKIPSLILQPFIENAIWHGLSSKKGDKSILLTFKKESNSYLIITIEDNGIGRKKSSEIKKNKIHKRESIGIQLTEDRLENFAKSFNNDFDINFIDLFNKENKPKGTKVILKIPLK